MRVEAEVVASRFTAEAYGREAEAPKVSYLFTPYLFAHSVINKIRQ